MRSPSSSRRCSIRSPFTNVPFRLPSSSSTTPTGSARHATVRVEPVGVVLEDEGSLNGTFVNGERIEQRLLEEGDRIQIGPHLLLFVPAA